MASEHSHELLERIQGINNKRAKIVLEHILANGSISTEDLQSLGYDHPPRAARDVRELGIQLITTIVRNSSGRRMASYTFADAPLDPRKTGRIQLSKKVRSALIREAGGKCEICRAEHNLQVDHRIPYQVAGESAVIEKSPYQVLCGSCNRTKSWDCEHCPNMEMKDIGVCLRCYWANQQDYDHIKTVPERRIDVVWNGNELQAFDKLREQAKRNGRTPSEELKSLLR